MKKTDETRNYDPKEIEQNELTSKKHKKVCTTLNYIQSLLILASAITRCISISAFTSLFSGSIRITSSVIGLQICPITTRIKHYKSIIKKRKRSMKK